MKIVIINGFDVNEHRVDALLKFFRKGNNDIKVLSTNFLHREKIRRLESKDGYRFVNTTPYKKNLSVGRIYSHWKLAKNIFSLIDSNVDLLWIILPPNSFVRQAAMYKKKFPNTKIVLDIMDMWPETLPVGKIKELFPFTLWKKIRNNYLHLMDFVVTECELYQTVLNKYIISSKMERLYLSYGDIEKLPKIKKLPINTISLCYLGSINNIIDIKCIDQILKSISIHKQVYLHIIGGGENKDLLLKVARKSNVKVIDHGMVYDEKVKRDVLTSCHYGLNIMKDSVFVGLTMKSLDYFKYGLPIINNIKGDTWSFVETKGIGINTISGQVNIDSNEYDYSIRHKTINFYNEYFSEVAFESQLDSILNNVFN
ncbi:hypothetical protein [Streptococcus parasuis]|uniref:hypothetical protein n=1 Tax=Streptococcus parasuis TaxID=1501662 RepID=UPI0028A62121|nr:hypothetical protein [Streptococcus parasuis]